jgi:UDP-N-acetylmuramoylalanine--D-glutamate ligase
MLVILGAGESGVGAAILGKQKGYDVFVSDGGVIGNDYKKTLEEYEIKFESAQHKEVFNYQPTLIVKSPGISEKTELVQHFLKKNIPVISEIELAGMYKNENAKMICITGSNGKTTTTLLTYHLLKNAGYDVGLGGNIGMSLARMVAENPHEYYVVELSSFQLDGMYSFKADVAILLNITPDHLDRYDYKFENYVASKFRILQNQDSKNSFVINKDDQVINSFYTGKDFGGKKYFISNIGDANSVSNEHELIFNVDDKKMTISTSVLTISGLHNRYNALAAGTAAILMGLKQQEIESGFSTFKNAEHRLEKVATIDEVVYINDSKATNVDSVWYALESMKTPVIWIVGGVDKGNDYSVLMTFVNKKVKGIICLGKDNSKLQKQFGECGKLFHSTSSIADAVAKAKEWGVKGDTVLLSPACASFDLFKNYIDRGNQFKNIVHQLVTQS